VRKGVQGSERKDSRLNTHALLRRELVLIVVCVSGRVLLKVVNDEILEVIDLSLLFNEYSLE
jgi:hypothetical protein